jgi:glycerol-3-phosphate acyltransferase PlsY
MTVMWIACVAGAYLVGSIPFGVLIGKARGVDIREHGSKNIGATNVGRVLGKPLGIICFILDVLKGAVPVLTAGMLTGTLGHPPDDLTAAQMWLWLAVAAAAIVGHMASVFLGFVGGKGVATSFGAMLAMWPLLTLPALAALVVWYAMLRLFRFVSLASIIAAVSLPMWYAASIVPSSGAGVVAALAHGAPPLVVTAMLAAFVVWRHRGNIARLRRGEEPKIGDQRDRDSSPA